MLAGKPTSPVDRMTDTCENITLPQTSFAGGNENAVMKYWSYYESTGKSDCILTPFKKLKAIYISAACSSATMERNTQSLAAEISVSSASTLSVHRPVVSE